jgi:hypothetical protein
MAKKSPGIDPMGYGPFGKEKLEGPKVHHDYHGKDASVPAKGNARAIPNQHWEMHYDLCEPSRNMYLTEGADFVAKEPNKRKTTYQKVNEEDH